MNTAFRSQPDRTGTGNDQLSSLPFEYKGSLNSNLGKGFMHPVFSGCGLAFQSRYSLPATSPPPKQRKTKKKKTTAGKESGLKLERVVFTRKKCCFLS